LGIDFAPTLSLSAYRGEIALKYALLRPIRTSYGIFAT
jgi:hypothetical protein